MVLTIFNMIIFSTCCQTNLSSFPSRLILQSKKLSEHPNWALMTSPFLINSYLGQDFSTRWRGLISSCKTLWVFHGAFTPQPISSWREKVLDGNDDEFAIILKGSTQLLKTRPIPWSWILETPNDIIISICPSQEQKIWMRCNMHTQELILTLYRRARTSC